MSLFYNGKLIARAKKLRKDATPQENRLWYEFFRTYPVRFQRQKTIDNFIVDFYCHKAKLAVEIDGSQHYTEDGLAYDRERDATLSALGVLILRFSNTEVERNFQAVCEEIDRLVQTRRDKLPQSR